MNNGRTYDRLAQRQRRRNQTLFFALVRATCRNGNPYRGEVDSRTGDVWFSHRGTPRPVSTKRISVRAVAGIG